MSSTIRDSMVAGAMEYAFGEVPWRGELIRPAERVVDGFVEVPDTPGLGIELDQAIAAAHAAR